MGGMTTGWQLLGTTVANNLLTPLVVGSGREEEAALIKKKGVDKWGLRGLIDVVPRRRRAKTMWTAFHGVDVRPEGEESEKDKKTHLQDRKLRLMTDVLYERQKG
jgi:hypothetical protein